MASTEMKFNIKLDTAEADEFIKELGALFDRLDAKIQQAEDVLKKLDDKVRE